MAATNRYLDLSSLAQSDRELIERQKEKILARIFENALCIYDYLPHLFCMAIFNALS